MKWQRKNLNKWKSALKYEFFYDFSFYPQTDGSDIKSSTMCSEMCIEFWTVNIQVH